MQVSPIKTFSWNGAPVGIIQDMYKFKGMYTLVEDGIVKGFFKEEELTNEKR